AEAKVGEVKAGSHHAADQNRRLASGGGTLPDPARDQDLRLLAGVQIAAEQDSAAGGRLIAVPPPRSLPRRPAQCHMSEPGWRAGLDGPSPALRRRRRRRWCLRCPPSFSTPPPRPRLW